MQRAMMWWCWAVIGFGIVLVGAGFAATDAPAMLLLERFGGQPVVPTAALRFSVGLMGAVTLGWGGSLLALASAGLANEVARPLWRRIGWAVLAWYLIDSVVSVATWFWPNAVSNTVLAACFWLIVRR